MLLKKPEEVGWVEAGGIPENWMTGDSLCSCVDKEANCQPTKRCFWKEV